MDFSVQLKFNEKMFWLITSLEANSSLVTSNYFVAGIQTNPKRLLTKFFLPR